MSAPAATPAATATRSRWFWPAFVVGWVVMIGAGIGAVTDDRRANLPALIRYIVVFDVVHDLAVAPIALAVGWLVTRLVPAVARGPVRAALAMSAIVAVFAYPLVRRLGARATNSSALPLDYGPNVLIVIASIWSVAASVIALRIARTVRAKRDPGTSDATR